MSSTVINIPKMYTEAEVAELLGCCTKTVARERERGKLGFVTIPGKIRYREDQVRRYIDDQTVAPCQETNENSAAGSGSASTEPAHTGKSPGMTGVDDRRVASALAKRTLGELRSRSRNTSSRPRDLETPTLTRSS